MVIYVFLSLSPFLCVICNTNWEVVNEIKLYFCRMCNLRCMKQDVSFFLFQNAQCALYATGFRVHVAMEIWRNK